MNSNCSQEKKASVYSVTVATTCQASDTRLVGVNSQSVCGLHNWHVYWCVLAGSAVLRYALATTVQGELKGKMIRVPKVW